VNCATFRFYAGLNDFRHRGCHKKNSVLVKGEHPGRLLTFEFNGNPGIKDAIESLGVPHPEVDLILVRGRPVDFSYHLQHDDAVSVYPVFVNLELASNARLVPLPIRPLRFILDVHLGRLARYLRLLGFDTLYNNRYDDREIISLAIEQQRIILTRDIGLLKNGRVIWGYWLRSQDAQQQLHEVATRFSGIDELKPFTRCALCNGRLLPVEKTAIMAQLEPCTRKYYDVFFRCCDCGKVYWRGSHYVKLQQLVTEVETL